MRVFLSWSGPVSQQIAHALREWLPSVVQAVKPWMSKNDIYKGARWQNEIAGELEKSQFGIVCVTPTNMAAPWLLYEAGALAKHVTAARVCPYVFGMEPASIDGPLAQFQAARTDKSDTHALVQSVNAALVEPIATTTLDRVFERAWPELDELLTTVRVEAPVEKPVPLDRDAMIAETLELVRRVERTVSGLPSSNALLAELSRLLDAYRVGNAPPAAWPSIAPGIYDWSTLIPANRTPLLAASKEDFNAMIARMRQLSGDAAQVAAKADTMTSPGASRADKGESKSKRTDKKSPDRDTAD